MNVSKSVLLEQDGNKINVNGVNCENVVIEILEFMIDEFEKDYIRYKKYGGLYEVPKLNTSLISFLNRQKERIESIVDSEDIKKVLGINDIEFFNKTNN